MRCGLLGEVDDGRIEIELTPVEPSRRRAQPPSVLAPVTAAPPVGETDDAPARERRHLIVTAMVVGLGALLLGWVLGRSGGDAPAATPTPSTSERPPAEQPTTTVRPGLGALDTLPPVTEPAETTLPFVPIRPTVGTSVAVAPTGPEGPEATSVELDPRVAGLDVQLVGYAGFQHLHELDLSTGTLLDYGGVSSDVWQIIAGDDWIVLPVYNGLDSYVIRADGVIDRVSLGGDVIVGLPALDTFWTSGNNFGATTELRETDLFGEETGRTIVLPPNTWPEAADPLGGVVVRAGGRLFSLFPEAAEDLGRGDLVALSEHTVVTYECEADLRCGLRVYDRASGVRAEVPSDPSLGIVAYPGLNWTGLSGDYGLSPDRTRLITVLQSETSEWRTALVDLATGVVTIIEEATGGQPGLMVWLDDRYAAFLDGRQRLHAYDTVTGESFPVFAGDQPSWSTITRRVAGD